jgi:light-regulated signal transduction histidine kinase (bacteriophytochrome)
MTNLPNTDACDREPIHLVNAIQPHAALLVVREPEGDILQASANIQDFLGFAPEELIGSRLADRLGRELSLPLQAALTDDALCDGLVHVLRMEAPRPGLRPLHVFANRIDGLLVLEFERAGAIDAADCRAQSILRQTIQRLQGTDSLPAFLAMAVEQVRILSGFERVMAYRFEEDGSGEVVAESMADGLESYLGLHYPASDIPAPARRLFALSALRHLPDVDYVPVPLLPDSPATGLDRPVDLSYTLSRSVSLMYTGYLRNMGVKATLVMPVMKAGRLWGLISCMHHSAPRYLSYEQRTPVELLGHMLSQLIASRCDLEELEYRELLGQTLNQLSHQMRGTESLAEGLLAGGTTLLSNLDADGVVLMTSGGIHRKGETPDDTCLLPLVEWLHQQPKEILATHHLVRDYPPARAFLAKGAGILAMRLTQTLPDCIIWFRPEVIQEVSWAGDPHKPVEVDSEGAELGLRPRTSFAQWRETVAGQSRRWLACEIDHASRLRHAILDIVVERAWHLARVNAELERSNLELDSFAYAASHDMKEPLRGIYNTVEFLNLEEAERLSETGRNRLRTILRLTGRMTDLMDSLLQYSRIGRGALHREPTQLEPLARQVASVIQSAQPESRIRVDIAADLPTVACDRILVGTILQNLMSNAAKYNANPEPSITFGCDAGQNPPVFFVRDNGIGIAAADQGKLFELFRRLHGREEYGGGTGAGLTIVRKAVERHGGRIWLDSTPGEGSTFYFTLAAAPGPA